MPAVLYIYTVEKKYILIPVLLLSGHMLSQSACMLSWSHLCCHDFTYMGILSSRGTVGGGATGPTLFSAPQCGIFLFANTLDWVSIHCQ